VLLEVVGIATLDFGQVPGSEGHATLAYSDGREVAKAIRRTPL
jgi:hypothetical protein